MNDYVDNNYFLENNTKSESVHVSDNTDYDISIKNKEKIDAYKKSESYSKKIKVTIVEKQD
ncbi:MAG: hypothetical protein ACYDIA_15295 [Candidatus Humimicrobiaceae bacterium]